MKKSKHQKKCNYCEFISSDKSQQIIERNESFFSLVSFFQYSDGHLLIITKEHRADVSELTKEEWSNLLPILKSSINKINKVFCPRGFSIITRKGKIAGQNIFHFHLHIIPEYSEDYNYLKTYTAMDKISSQEYEEVKKILCSDEQGIFGNNKKATISLVNRTQSKGIPHVVITSKNSIRHINKVDVETWEAMGELMQENIKRIEDEIFPESPSTDKGLRFLISLDKINGTNLQECDDSKLQIHIAQTYDRGSNLSLKGKRDIMETIEKLKNIDDSRKLNFSQQSTINKDTITSLSFSNEPKKDNIEEIVVLRKEIDELKRQLSERNKLIEKLTKVCRENEQKLQNQTEVNFSFIKNSP